ncbi:MAG: MoaD/ThiS family protein [Planctomycetota bacterium]
MPRAPSITIRVPTPLRAASNGASEIALPAATVRAALTQIAERYPTLHQSICDETGAVRRHVNLFVNSAHIRDLAQLDTPFAQGDTLTILPAVSGGLPCPNA